MHADTACDLPTLYHQTEDHYFAATCSLHRRYNACINAYFTGEYFDPWNLLFIRVGSAPLGGGYDSAPGPASSYFPGYARRDS